MPDGIETTYVDKELNPQWRAPDTTPASAIAHLAAQIPGRFFQSLRHNLGTV